LKGCASRQHSHPGLRAGVQTNVPRPRPSARGTA
jgi:hypothetical protein